MNVSIPLLQFVFVCLKVFANMFFFSHFFHLLCPVKVVPNDYTFLVKTEQNKRHIKPQTHKQRTEDALQDQMIKPSEKHTYIILTPLNPTFIY